MIRFACPGCGAKYTVDDARAGKATRCKRCRTKFLVPSPGQPPAPPPVPLDPPAPPPAPPRRQALDNEWSTPPKGPPRPSVPELPQLPAPPKFKGVEIAPCPGCHAQLTVNPDSLGSNVECPHCHTIFAAVKPGAIVGPPAVPDAEVVPPEKPRREDDEPRPTRRGRAKVGGRREVTGIGVLSATKMSGAMSFVGGLLVSLVYAVFAFILFLIGTSAGGDAGGLLGLGLLYVVCSLILYPIIMGVSGFLGGAVSALIYNLLATMIGGVEIDLE